MSKNKSDKAEGKRRENIVKGLNLIKGHPLFRELYAGRTEVDSFPGKGWVKVNRYGILTINKSVNGSPEEWAYMIAHGLLHLGLEHFVKKDDPVKWNMACDCYIARFLADLKFGSRPFFVQDVKDITDMALTSETVIYQALLVKGTAEKLTGYGTWSDGVDMDMKESNRARWYRDIDWAKKFTDGLTASVTRAVHVAGGYQKGLSDSFKMLTKAKMSKNWFINSYPLLGALAATFEIVEDPLICGRMDVRVAAVSETMQEIYINPAAGLDEHEMRFVMAHELLHVALRHSGRCQGRYFYYWNIACDYVINSWLIEMGVGELPKLGVLYDPALKGLSAESVYDIIVSDVRKYRKLASLRGTGIGDIIDHSPGSNNGSTIELDEFYRKCIAEGLTYHESQGRGYLPSGLVEEIRALSQPPIPWDVELARWFDGFINPVEKIRTYARISRRQSSTPDIPRPSYRYQSDRDDGRTFGVVLDTSGSMDRTLLAKALGAIAQYGMTREVPYVRLVCCDAVAYDEGYVAPEAIAERFKVRGRGGTVLQPGIDLLEKADDFPKKGPILIITDGNCDRLNIRREHAYLLPYGAKLPFAPKGKVFRFK